MQSLLFTNLLESLLVSVIVINVVYCMLTGMLICVLWVVTWTPIFLTQLCVCVCVRVCVCICVWCHSAHKDYQVKKHILLTAVNRWRTRKKREWKSCLTSSNVETTNCCLSSVTCLISQINHTSQGLSEKMFASSSNSSSPVNTRMHACTYTHLCIIVCLHTVISDLRFQ